MINIIFLIFAVLGLIFLFFQQRMNSKQEELIKSETKALRKLRRINDSFCFNRSLVLEKKDYPQPEIVKPTYKKVLPKVRDFEFPKSITRRSKTSMISN